MNEKIKNKSVELTDEDTEKVTGGCTAVYQGTPNCDKSNVTIDNSDENGNITIDKGTSLSHRYI